MDDIEFMHNPDQWPQWPLLPVKRRHEGEQQVGLMIELGMSGPQPTVYLDNLFSFRGDTDNTEKIQYESFKALVEDGWRVD